MTNIFDAIEKGDLELVKALIEAGTNLEEFNDEGLLPIHLAAISNNFQIVKLLIENGADINAESSLGISLAHIAAGQFNPDQLGWLLEKGVDINIEGAKYILPIHVAAMAGSLENVKWFFDKGAEDKAVKGLSLLHTAVLGNFDNFLQSIKNGNFLSDSLEPILDELLPKYLKLLNYLLNEKGYDVNIENDEGITPFCIAVSCGHVGIMNFLKECGARVEMRNILDFMPDATRSGVVEVIKWFIAEGIDINKVDEGSDIHPIFIAAKEGYVQVMEYLFERGFDLDSLGYKDMSLMHYAVLSDKPEVIEWLLAKGLDINMLSVDNFTPASFASWNGKINALKYLAGKGADVNLEYLNLRNNPKLTIELVQWLESRGYYIKKEGHSLMHCAAYNGQIDVIEYLLSEGLDINAKNEEGKTPIYYATQKGRFKAIKYLYEHGADLKIQDNNGNTLMHISAKKGRMHIIQWLLDQDIPIDVANSEGKTPVNSAAQKGRLKVIEFLGKKGADISNIESYAEDLIRYAAIEQDVKMINLLQERGVNIKGLNFIADLQDFKIIKISEWISQYGVKVIILDEVFEFLAAQAAIKHDDQIAKWLQNYSNDNQVHCVISKSPGTFTNLEAQIKGTYWLLEKGIKVKIKGQIINLIILKVSLEEEHKIIKWFEDLNIKIDDFVDCWQETLTVVACMNKVKLANWVKKCGGDLMDINLRDNYGSPLIHRCIRENNIPMLKWFIEHGADLAARDSNDFSPLHSALMFNHLQCFKLLLEHGADCNDRSLSIAVMSSKAEFITLLCSFKANIDLANTLICSYFTNLENFQQLLNQGTVAEQIRAGLHILDSLKTNLETRDRGIELEQILIDKINQARPDILDNLDLLNTKTNLKAILINLDKCKALEGLKEKIQDFDHESPSFRSLGFLTDIEKLNLTQSLEVKERKLMVVATNVENDGSATSSVMHNPGIVERITSFLSREDQVNLFVSPVANDDQTDVGSSLPENPQMKATGEE